MKGEIDFKNQYFDTISNICNELRISDELCNIAKSFAEELHNYGYYSRKPSCVAGASIYLACMEHGLKISQIRIAVSAKISDRSLRSTYKEMKKILKK